MLHVTLGGARPSAVKPAASLCWPPQACILAHCRPLGSSGHVHVFPPSRYINPHFLPDAAILAPNIAGSALKPWTAYYMRGPEMIADEPATLLEARCASLAEENERLRYELDQCRTILPPVANNAANASEVVALMPSMSLEPPPPPLAPPPLPPLAATEDTSLETIKLLESTVAGMREAPTSAGAVMATEAPVTKRTSHEATAAVRGGAATAGEEAPAGPGLGAVAEAGMASVRAQEQVAAAAAAAAHAAAATSAAAAAAAADEELLEEEEVFETVRASFGIVALGERDALSGSPEP